MTRRQVMLTFTPEIIAEPVIYNLGQQFRLVTNIRRADLVEDRGWIALDLDGEETDIEAGLAWITSRGIRVTPVQNETGSV